MAADKLLAFKPKYRKFTIQNGATVGGRFWHRRQRRKRCSDGFCDGSWPSFVPIRRQPVSSEASRSWTMPAHMSANRSSSAWTLSTFFRRRHRSGWNLVLPTYRLESQVGQAAHAISNARRRFATGCADSPRLSNLVNYRIDARIAGYAQSLEGPTRGTPTTSRCRLPRSNRRASGLAGHGSVRRRGRRPPTATTFASTRYRI